MSEKEAQEFKTNYRITRFAEKLKAKELDYQERHKGVMCKINFVSLLITIGLAIFTFLALKHTNEEGCPGTWVRSSLYLVLAMHATNII